MCEVYYVRTLQTMYDKIYDDDLISYLQKSPMTTKIIKKKKTVVNNKRRFVSGNGPIQL